VSDQRLRELERRFRASGSVEDEATWLRARMQAGELEQSKLDLAAHCGHEGARAALGENAPAPHRNLWKLVSTLSGDQHHALRAAVAIGTLLLASFDTGRRVLPVQEAVEATVSALNGSAAALGQAYSSWSNCGVDFTPADPGSVQLHQEILSMAAALAERSRMKKEAASAVRTNLATWALGYRDPVGERVEAQKREAAGEE
jgi:hypothetical protein